MGTMALKGRELPFSASAGRAFLSGGSNFQFFGTDREIVHRGASTEELRRSVMAEHRTKYMHPRYESFGIGAAFGLEGKFIFMCILFGFGEKRPTLEDKQSAPSQR